MHSGTAGHQKVTEFLSKCIMIGIINFLFVSSLEQLAPHHTHIQHTQSHGLTHTYVHVHTTHSHHLLELLAHVVDDLLLFVEAEGRRVLEGAVDRARFARHRLHQHTWNRCGMKGEEKSYTKSETQSGQRE